MGKHSMLKKELEIQYSNTLSSQEKLEYDSWVQSSDQKLMSKVERREKRVKAKVEGGCLEVEDIFRLQKIKQDIFGLHRQNFQPL